MIYLCIFGWASFFICVVLLHFERDGRREDKRRIIENYDRINRVLRLEKNRQVQELSDAVRKLQHQIVDSINQLLEMKGQDVTDRTRVQASDVEGEANPGYGPRA
jgi:hypothetical protein